MTLTALWAAFIVFDASLPTPRIVLAQADKVRVQAIGARIGASLDYLMNGVSLEE